MTNVLIVDDEEAFTSGMADYLRKREYAVQTANSLSSARQFLEAGLPDILLLDLMLPDGNGLDLFSAFEAEKPRQIVLITGHSGIKSLIGDVAGDRVAYMRKPISPGKLLTMLEIDESAPTDEDAGGETTFHSFVGNSDAMQSVYKKIEQVAKTDTAVFVTGESGTGKELVANAVHRLSGRSGDFVPVNCGALTKDLLSTQLFGHEKGSFTGADRKHVGFFERASGGTLFLDEITEMPVETQTHLLRVLETGAVLRVGAEKELKVDTRLVVASNRDPAEAIKDGKLREDLYFRISVFPIRLPPLRDRGDDAEQLANYFLAIHNRKNGTTRQLTRDSVARLKKHSWPGNVRELRHTVHKSYIVAEGDDVELQIDEEPGFGKKIEGLSPGRSIADVERDLILNTLEHFDGDKKAAASSLGISLKTLYNRLGDYESGGE